MKKFFLFSVAFAALASASTIAQAGMQSYLSLSVGQYNLLDEDQAVDLRTEYRSARSIVFQNMHPYAGLEVTSDGSTWVGGGLLYDYAFSPGWYITPSIGVGLYNQGGSRRDLDYPVQFRTQLEISYEFDNRHRAGLGFSHISNASLGNENPGTEVMTVYWHIPFGDVF